VLDSGVVYQTIDPAELAQAPLDDPAGLVRIGNRRHAEHRAAALLDDPRGDRLGLFTVDVVDHHGSASGSGVRRICSA
jgi:hypothetical protein